MPPRWPRALGDVVVRHESLRTVFAVGGRASRTSDVVPAGQARTRVAAGFTVAAAGPGELAGLVDAAAGYVFDLAAELPIRAWLFTLPGQEQVLVLVCHHIASDGWSMRVLMADWPRRTRPAGTAGPPEWAPLPVQYADYALWQRDLLGADQDPGSVMSGQVEYWREQLAGLPEELVLPSDRPRPAELSQRGGEVRWRAGRRGSARGAGWAGA